MDKSYLIFDLIKMLDKYSDSTQQIIIAFLKIVFKCLTYLLWAYADYLYF